MYVVVHLYLYRMDSNHNKSCEHEVPINIWSVRVCVRLGSATTIVRVNRRSLSMCRHSCSRRRTKRRRLYVVCSAVSNCVTPDRPAEPHIVRRLYNIIIKHFVLRRFIWIKLLRLSDLSCLSTYVFVYSYLYVPTLHVILYTNSYAKQYYHIIILWGNLQSLNTKFVLTIYND